MITNYNPMFGSKEQCEDLVRQIKVNNKTQEGNKNMKRIIVVVDMNAQIKEKFEIFKAIMGEDYEGRLDREGARLYNKHVEVEIVSSNSVRGKRGDHVLDMSKKNDKEYMDAIHRMEVTKVKQDEDDLHVKLQKMGIDLDSLSTLSALNMAKIKVVSSLSDEAVEYSSLLDKIYQLNMWVVANPPMK